MAKIAIAASRGIGDGLITLVLANNLLINHYDVTLFSNPISQLNGWFPKIEVLPYPKPEKFDEIFSSFDLTLSDAYSEITKNIDPKDFPHLAEKFVFFCMARFDSRLIYDQSHELRAKTKNEKTLNQLLPLTKASGVVINRLDKNAAMIDRVERFCKEILSLPKTTRENGIIPLRNLHYKHYPKRIVIHPTSSNPVKNWPAKKFIALARRLRTSGFEPVFVVSPAEKADWRLLVKDEFLLPEFPTLSELAKFVYESGYMIGTDSGIGHIASNLNIPTLTICRTGNKQFRWRPGWARGIVIKTKHKLTFAGKSHWHWLISVNRVFKAFVKFYNQPP